MNFMQRKYIEEIYAGVLNLNSQGENLNLL
jgi:hypothetical protein